MTLAPPGRAIDRDPSTDAEAVLDRFRDYRASGDRALRNELVETHRSLAVRLARRYQRTGESFDDLIQVAMLGVLKAVERFDPEREDRVRPLRVGHGDGELKRYFRDSTWTVRVPPDRTATSRSSSARPSSSSVTGSSGRRRSPRSPARRACRWIWSCSPSRPTRRTGPHPSTTPDATVGAAVLDALPRPGRRGVRALDDRDQVLGPAQPAPRTGTAHHRAPVLRGPDPDRDRRADRHQPDARVPAHRPGVGPSPGPGEGPRRCP